MTFYFELASYCFQYLSIRGFNTGSRNVPLGFHCLFVKFELQYRDALAVNSTVDIVYVYFMVTLFDMFKKLCFSVM